VNAKAAMRSRALQAHQSAERDASPLRRARRAVNAKSIARNAAYDLLLGSCHLRCHDGWRKGKEVNCCTTEVGRRTREEYTVREEIRTNSSGNIKIKLN
jgi:hypothetical protein